MKVSEWICGEDAVRSLEKLMDTGDSEKPEDVWVWEDELEAGAAGPFKPIWRTMVMSCNDYIPSL